MSEDSHTKLQELYEKARRLDTEERDRFLSQACAGEPAGLRQELEAMLRVDVPEKGPLGPAWAVRGSTVEPTGSLEAPSGLRRWGALDIIEKVSEGGFGEVFRARDTKLDRDVALKLLKSSASDLAGGETTVVREARLLAKVRHPNVLTVYGADQVDGRVGIWTEFVQGQTFEEIAREHGRLGPDEATLVGIDLTRALAAIHEAGLVHADVKPQNVMRQEGGRTLLMDLGAGREMTHVESGQSGKGWAGTPKFMAPELFRSEAPSVASDIYALGVTLCYLLSLRFPVDAKSMGELRRNHERRERLPIRDLRADLPSGIVEVLERATAHDSTDRFRSAGEMEQALRATIGASGPVVGSPPRRTRTVPRIAAVGLTLALLLVGAWLASDLVTGFFSPIYTVEAAFMVDKKGPDDVRLVQDSAVRPDDQLYVNLESSRDVYAYVINEDLNGETWLLFPMPGMELTNPLDANQVHRLPGPDDSGEEINWRVSSHGGQERFLIVVSPERPVEFEARIRDIPFPGEGTPRQLDRGTLGALRGVGAVAKAETPGGKGSRLLDFYPPLTPDVEKTRGTWARMLVVDNP